MAQDGDDIVSLPSPPPPRPAARQAAIESALRKFDGVEEAPAARPAAGRPSRIRWAGMQRRPAGALIAAAVLVVIGIPAIQVALREPPVAGVPEAGQFAGPQPDAMAAPPQDGQPAKQVPPPLSVPGAPLAPAPAEQRGDVAAAGRANDAPLAAPSNVAEDAGTPAPMVASALTPAASMVVPVIPRPRLYPSRHPANAARACASWQPC